MAITFGIPKQRVAKEEKYPDTPVITTLRWEGKGHANKFVFNTKAVEKLNILPGTSRVNFAFDEEEEVAYIGKHAGEGALSVGKNMSLSNKRFYDYILKMYKLESDEDNDFELTTEIDLGDVKVYKMTPLVNKEVELDPKPVNMVDKEIEHMEDPVSTEEGFEAVGIAYEDNSY